MGQTIEISSTALVGDVLLVDTDRSLAGQDGERFARTEFARNDDSLAAQLAARLFESDSNIDHIFVMSNAVSIRRPGGWSDLDRSGATTIISEFFRYYL